MTWRSNGTLICTIIALVAAGLFLTASSFRGDYTWVARLGGAGWVLLLSTIILMPTLAPWLGKRLAERDAATAVD